MIESLFHDINSERYNDITSNTCCPVSDFILNVCIPSVSHEIVEAAGANFMYGANSFLTMGPAVEDHNDHGPSAEDHVDHCPVCASNEMHDVISVLLVKDS